MDSQRPQTDDISISIFLRSQQSLWGFLISVVSYIVDKHTRTQTKRDNIAENIHKHHFDAIHFRTTAIKIIYTKLINNTKKGSTVRMQKEFLSNSSSSCDSIKKKSIFISLNPCFMWFHFLNCKFTSAWRQEKD